MNSFIQVEFELPSQPQEQMTVPVFYEILDSHTQKLKVVMCGVGLRDDKKPNWIQESYFQMVAENRNGRSNVQYNNPPNTNRDDAYFREKLLTSILIKEGKYARS